MIFDDIYDGVKRLFPTFYLPDSHINNIISDTYYLYTGTGLEGSGIYSPELNCYFVKDKEIQDLDILECVFDTDIITTYIIPYYIEYNEEIDCKTRVSILYNIFKDLCNRIRVNTDRMKTILKYTPYVLTMFLHIELNLNRIDLVLECLDDIDDNIKTYPDEFISKIQNNDLDILLNKGLLYGIVEECKLQL